MKWRPMSSAPKDKLILVVEKPVNGGKALAIPAMWGRAHGFEDKDAGWLGTTFSACAEALFDFPSISSRLIFLVPVAWAPCPAHRLSKLRSRWYHYAIMTEKGGTGAQQGCAWGKNIKHAESHIAADCHGKLRKVPESKCRQCQSGDDK